MRVLNKRVHTVLGENDVYIGRPSKWGNPFTIGTHGDREEVIHKYREYLIDSPLIDDIHELRGKNLVCWCAPKACHGDYLMDLLEELERNKRLLFQYFF